VRDPVAATRATYDVVAEEFRQRTWTPTFDLDAELDWLVDHLPPDGLVADVGCGPGRDTRLFRERGVKAIGVDLSMGMLRAAGLDGVAQGDMRALPIATAAVDGLWCNAALLHVPRPDVPGVLGELSRVVRDGGPLHLAVAEGDGDAWETGTYGGHRPRFFVHHRLDGLAPLLVEAGFSIVHVARYTVNRAWLRVRARKQAAAVAL
jgi:SAM-dependent methyltransferase